MTTTAATWFFREPERIPYYLEERINQNFWQARLYDIWLDCTRAEPPFQMSGVWREALVEIEWQPNEYLTLSVDENADADDLIRALVRVLALDPALSYEDAEGRRMTEWHVNGGQQRWQAIQGKAAFHNPRRL